ncbi:MAG: hypothetical protein AUJ92_11355 [Armatimonadetes bacterium CG2_30_59_28]|nr:hypothetical protein [Armatimonadota bacterium]OIO93910.1 MAG: hypothetical protein AUJ92_11355 [Armatimonadetes bacterium CG2_30_59_28]PIU64812.1 MAG: hypothetical protein COS85_11105 [Armatimonadetes bacterium CG07_land_8_20_14_0_80_59_28]PIX38401.1 MAG: hypothetical protein COZ56_20535 [Armatimonadetes bacterium CG_4_8_14_3_um_filter_58_9]PJB72663.1 MAG: hypothetical protein CO095_06600 [Armatimonadetes bacterium CG_4_9_14_3_um_filter_58_7]
MLRARDADRALVGKLGFEKTESHHHVYRLWLQGTLVARTFVSHGERGLSPYHIAQMARQMHLSAQEFTAAVRCPLTRQQYLELLQERIPNLEIGEE